MTVKAKRHCLAISRNHIALPIAFAFQVFELPNVMYFNVSISFAAKLTLPCGQPIHQAGSAGILCRIRYRIYSGSLLHGFSRKALIVKQPYFLLSFLIGKSYSKVFAHTKFCYHLAHTGTIFGCKSLEHTVLHDVAKRACERRIVGDTVIIAKAPDLTVVLVKNFKVIIIFEVVTSFSFPITFAINRSLQRCTKGT